MCFIILFDLINKINIILYLKDLKLAPNHDLIIEVFTEVRNDLFPVDSLYIGCLFALRRVAPCWPTALASLFGCSRHLHLWNCTYFPVSMLERDGQHMGVVTKALEKEVPPSSIMRRVLFIACIDPTWRNPRLAHCKACPPALVISSLVSVENCSKSFAS